MGLALLILVLKTIAFRTSDFLPLSLIVASDRLVASSNGTKANSVYPGKIECWVATRVENCEVDWTLTASSASP
jgi:hypothetical protein